MAAVLKDSNSSKKASPVNVVDLDAPEAGATQGGRYRGGIPDGIFQGSHIGVGTIALHQGDPSFGGRVGWTKAGFTSVVISGFHGPFFVNKSLVLDAQRRERGCSVSPALGKNESPRSFDSRPKPGGIDEAAQMGTLGLCEAK